MTESNFVVQQESYQAKAREFFACPEKYARLHKLVVNGDRLSSMVFYFVKEFEKGKVVNTTRGIFIMCDEYRNAITNHKKRYYNFESKEGKGDLIWGGAVNPRFLVNPDRGAIALPLPRRVAFQWFIQYGFDVLFWERYDEVCAAYTSFTTSVKRRYTEAHKSKKRADRMRVEREVIEAREGPPVRKGKKSVYLTRAERQMVSRLLEEQRKKRKKKHHEKQRSTPASSTTSSQQQPSQQQQQQQQQKKHQEKPKPPTPSSAKPAAAVAVTELDGKPISI